eukprot:9467614-Pyramimonas_sp.AAC.1
MCFSSSTPIRILLFLLSSASRPSAPSSYYTPPPPLPRLIPPLRREYPWFPSDPHVVLLGCTCPLSPASAAAHQLERGRGGPALAGLGRCAAEAEEEEDEDEEEGGGGRRRG